MTTPSRFLASLVWGTRVTPTACVFGWREKDTYVAISEQALPFWPEAVAVRLRDRTCNKEPLSRVWVDNEQMAAALTERGVPGIIAVQPQDVENGQYVFSTAVDEGRLIVTPRCPTLLGQYRSARASDKDQGGAFLLALTNLLACENALTEVEDGPVPPEKQATIVWVPGKGYVDNPVATHAREMAGYGEDPFFATWTDAVDTSDGEALEASEAFCRFMGAPLPDFLRQKRAGLR